jgi:hypothetical protein
MFVDCIRARQYVAIVILSVYFKYDWLHRNASNSEVEKEKARNDSIWAVFDCGVFASLFLAGYYH